MVALGIALIIGVVIELVVGHNNSPEEYISGQVHQGHNSQQDVKHTPSLTTGFKPYNGVDPLRDMEIDMLDINLNAAPNRKYYNLVMGVYNAVQKGLLIPVLRTYDIGERFIETELYTDSEKPVHEIRLPSAKAIISARSFFDREMKAERQKLLEEDSIRKQETRPKTTHIRINKSYGSGRKCHLYKGLLNNMFPIDYVENPIRDLQIHHLNFDVSAKPEENYYILVLKVNDAVKRGILTPKQRSWDYGEHFIQTQIYQYSNENRELRLVSHKALSQAVSYFRRKIDEECESSSEEYSSSDSKQSTSTSDENSDKGSGDSGSDDDSNEINTSHSVKVHVSAAVHEEPDEHLSNSYHKCDTPDAVAHYRRKMHEIDVDSKPNDVYFKLVLRVNRAVQCHLLVTIKGTLQTGVNGIHTQLYRVVEDNSRVRLVSTSDQSRARAFFHNRHSAIKEMHDNNEKASSSTSLDMH